jgi:hypothetical protein
MKARTKFWANLANMHFDAQESLEIKYVDILQHLSDVALLALIKECRLILRKQSQNRSAGEEMSSGAVLKACYQTLNNRGLRVDGEKLISEKEYRDKYGG